MRCQSIESAGVARNPPSPGRVCGIILSRAGEPRVTL
jgi:hypothetical protein